MSKRCISPVTISSCLQISIFLLSRIGSHPVKIDNILKLSIRFPGYNRDNNVRIPILTRMMYLFCLEGYSSVQEITNVCKQELIVMRTYTSLTERTNKLYCHSISNIILHFIYFDQNLHCWHICLL